MEGMARGFWAEPWLRYNYPGSYRGTFRNWRVVPTVAVTPPLQKLCILAIFSGTASLRMTLLRSNSKPVFLQALAILASCVEPCSTPDLLRRFHSVRAVLGCSTRTWSTASSPDLSKYPSPINLGQTSRPKSPGQFRSNLMRWWVMTSVSSCQLFTLESGGILMSSTAVLDLYTGKMQKTSALCGQNGPHQSTRLTTTSIWQSHITLVWVEEVRLL
jgi:hypothetical protein